MTARSLRVAVALVAAGALFGIQTVFAQAEIVPAEHLVYDFLHQQRVRGHLPEYRHEFRPMGRADVQRHLDSLEVRRDGMGRLDGRWLDQYRREFFEHDSPMEVVFDGRRVRIPRDPDSEKYFYYTRDEDWRFALNFGGAAQVRALDSADRLIGGLALMPAVRIQGNYRRWLGFYSESFTGQQFTGDAAVLRSDPVMAPMYFVAFGDGPQGNFERTSASFRIANRHLSAEIGHQRFIVGTGFSHPLVMSDGADYFSAVRLGVQGPLVSYQVMHSALGDRARWFTPEGNPEGESVALAPQRYLIMHRVTADPFPWFTFGFSEMVVYGMRGPELAYLNPVNMLWSAETALWDRDNALVAVEFILRPFRGIEGQFTWLVDDFDFGQVGQNSLNNLWAIQTGVGVAFDGGVASVEYTRIEPWVYTHRFHMDGSFYNAYHHNRFPLGHPLGPNTDQWAVGVRTFLPGRVQAEVQARYVRRGENYFDEQGEYVNVGGDLNQGFKPPFGEPLKIFLAGDRFEGPGASIAVSWEPFRGLAFRLWSDYQRWDRDPNHLFARWEMIVNF
jgi:hypothetical protein